MRTASHFVRLRTLILILAASLFLIPNGFCADGTVDVIPDETVSGSVELTPGYISGSVYFGGQNTNRIDIVAQSDDYSAKIYPQTEGDYTLTVNVPQGGAVDYTVSGMIWMDNWNTKLFYKDRTTVVADGQTSQVDFVVHPGTIVGQIVAEGCTIAKGEVWAKLDTGEKYSQATIRFGAQDTFRLPIQPNAGIRVYGQVTLASGATYNLAEKSIDVVAGKETVATWTINCGPGQPAAIDHTVDYHMPMDHHYSYLYNQGSWSPFKSVKHQGRHLFDNIAPGYWRLYTYSYWNNGKNLIAKNINNVYAPAGGTVDVTVDEYPGFLQGTVTLNGTQTIQDTQHAYIYGYGKNPAYPSYQTSSRALIGDEDGAYNLALPMGEWDAYVSTFFFANNDPAKPYLQSHLYMYDYSRRATPLFINEKQVIGDHDITYETGSATIKYSRSDGGSFSSPYIYAKCYNYDGSVLNEYIYSYSRGAADGDTVTFVGFPGTYEVEAWAYVDGSLTTFGKVAVEIVPGVDKVIDIGGPVLDVKTPTANATLAEARVVVTGTASDESGVDRVLVNGEMALLSATGNADDPNEVAFTIELPVEEGEMLIETIAIDTSGNQSTDKRTVTCTLPESDAVAVAMDIKPGSCKNPFNIKSKGVLPVVLLGSEQLDVAAIDISSIRLMGVSPVRSAIEDELTAYDASADEMVAANCSIEAGDGYDDLLLKFKTQDLVSRLGDVADQEELTLTLTATGADGQEISAEDTITILVKGSPVKSGKKR